MAQPELHFIIIAPHGDDEIIGCSNFLLRAKKFGTKTSIFYASEITANERRLCHDFGINCLGHEDHAETEILNSDYVTVLVAPDPYFETHPEHRRWGAWAESFGRQYQSVSLFFYSTIMTAPYIREVPHPESKKFMLEQYYIGKRSLWEYDHKYFLFEGQCQWIDPFCGLDNVPKLLSTIF